MRTQIIKSVRLLIMVLFCMGLTQAIAQAPPAAPSGLIATAVSPTQINLTWVDNSNNEHVFQIERSTTPGVGFIGIGGVQSNSTFSFNDGLTANTTYYYRIQAFNLFWGTSAYSNEASATTLPTGNGVAPSGLTATAVSQTQITLMWSDNSNDETGFEIERSTTSGSGFTLIQTTAANATSFSSTGLTTNTTYYYRIRAISTGGNTPYTAEANATTFPNPPAAPSGLIATAVSPTQINLTWVDNSNNEDVFRIERSTTPGIGFMVIQGMLPNSTSFSNTGLTANTTYYYRIRATNAGAASEYSNESSATTQSNANGPAAPNGLTATTVSQTQINLTWTDNSTDETGFEIERSNTSGGAFSLIQTTAANATSFTSSGLNPNTTYYFRVRAINVPGNSAYTSEVSISTLTVEQHVINEFAFQYRYDERKRIIMKKVPGVEPIYMVYDNRDRLVLTQDGNQRLTNKWTFTKYDQLNRPIITGIYTHNELRTQQEMSALISSVNFFDTYDGSGTFHGYTNNVFPISNLDILTVTYYDNYSFKSVWGSSYNYQDENLTATVINGTYNEPDAESTTVIGQVTGTKTKVLDGGSTYLKTITYYDDRYRAIQVISDTYKGGTVAGSDRVTTLYDFPGKVLKIKSTHLVGTGSQKIIARRLEYDHGGRLLKTFHQVDAQAEVLLSKNEYNELGQLVDKKLHSTDGTTFKQSIDHRYNIRGWLTSINNSKLNNFNFNDDVDDLFGMELGYNGDLGLGASPQFNGNISSIKWSNNTVESNIIERGYTFTYDPMNRLKTASQKQSILPNIWTSGNYNENISEYDLNGNIKFLQRTDGTGTLIDNLTYGYSLGTTGSNQLLYVHDTESATQGFVNGNTGTDDYNYDANGNLIVDKNKGITSIAYNHLNLPSQVNKSASDYIQYIYDATGRKLEQKVFGSATKTTDYSGEFIYENNALKLINHEEGRILPDGANWEYQYHLKDHLGNVRMTFTSKEETEVKAATLEPPNEVTERGAFLRFDEARKVQSFLFDYTNGSSPSTTTGYAQRLNGSANEIYGLGRSISVSPGDVVSAEAYAKYVDPNSSNWTAAFTTLIGQIAASQAGTVVDGPNYNNSTTSFPFPGEAPQNTAGSTGSGPKAYLNWLVFKRDGTWIPAQSGYDRLSADPKENGLDVNHERLYSPDITINEPGLVYFYLSNEEGTPVEVYFDDFKVTQTIKIPVVQSDDYYPFGLTFNSYSRENSVENKYLYNQGTGEKTFHTERQFDLGLNVDQSRDRTYDYITGRWWQLDPKADQEGQESWSPNHFSFNNPIRYNDPYGDCPECPSVGELLTAAVESVSTWLGSLLPGGNDGSAETASKVGDAMNTMSAVTTETQAMKERVQGAAEEIPVLNVAASVMSAQQAPTTGETMKHLGKAAIQANQIPVVSTGPAALKISPKNQVPRNQLNAPTKPGNAPTFKKDGTSVEIHHVGQKANGPYKEMHRSQHREGANYSKNHPAGQKPLTAEQRKAFNKQRSEYWRSQYPTRR